MSLNPYAPPSVAMAPPTAGASSVGIYREGDLLVVPARGANLPPRCVHCNAPSVQTLSRKLFWHAQGYYLLFFLSWPIYLVVAMLVRKTAQVEVGLCQAHVTRRRRGIALGWGGAVLGIAVLVATLESAPVVALLGLLVTAVSMIAGFRMVLLVVPKRIDNTMAWLKVGRPFLDSF